MFLLNSSRVYAIRYYSKSRTKIEDSDNLAQFLISLKTAFKILFLHMPQAFLNHTICFLINISIFGLYFLIAATYIKKWSPFSCLNHHIIWIPSIHLDLCSLVWTSTSRRLLSNMSSIKFFWLKTLKNEHTDMITLAQTPLRGTSFILLRHCLQNLQESKVRASCNSEMLNFSLLARSLSLCIS